MTIASTARIADGVALAADTAVGDYVIVGEHPEGSDSPPPATSIGAGARIRSHTVIYAGVVAGDGLQTGHGALIREHTTIGDNVSIGSHSIIEHHVTIGNRVRVHSAAFIPEYCVLEDDCWIGPRVVLTNAPHPRCVNLPRCLSGVTVGRGAKVGANATILPGVVIGENALVGAGAVVTKDVPAGAVVAGSPAQERGNIDDLICPYDGVTHPYGVPDTKESNS
jgi:acetyltransferase-like isoleucine patch superfamily enzyme